MPGAGEGLVRPAPLKRLMDVVVAGAALVVLSPVLLALWIAVRRRMGRPALFRQVRPGLNGRPFEMFKFRTMRDAIGPDGTPLPDAERLTPFGRWLRATSLDELPELWNVLRGEMSLVGPRPLLMEYLPYYSNEERRRHDLRPGVTGWAQVNGRNASPWDERLAADLWYVHNRTLALDVRVLALTIRRILDRNGVVIDPRTIMQDFDVERRNRLVIRRLNIGELRDAALLIREAYDLALFKHTVNASPNFPDFFSDIVGRSDQVFGAFRDKTLAGVFQARLIDGGLYLNNFAVAPDERGWGLANLLLDAFHRWADGRPTELHVDSRNSAALRFYLRNGYREVEAVSFTTIELAPERRAKGLIAEAIEDEVQLSRYGVGHLRVKGSPTRFGLIAPDHLVVPACATKSEVGEMCSLAGVSCMTIPENLGGLVDWGRVVATWKRIKMVRE